MPCYSISTELTVACTDSIGCSNVSYWASIHVHAPVFFLETLFRGVGGIEKLLMCICVYVFHISHTVLLVLQWQWSNFVSIYIYIPYLPFRDHLFSGSSDNTIKMWSNQTLELLASFKAHDDPVCTLACSESLLFSGSLRSIKVQSNVAAPGNFLHRSY